MNTLVQGVFDEGSVAALNLSVSDFLICICVSLLIGMFLAYAYAYKSTYTKSFIMTMGMLPAIVCVVIMMVNGNVGAGVAVAGAFSLVRFRSVPGTAKEIAAIFLAMGCGLICGMGYLFFAVLFAGILGVGMMVFTASSIGTYNENEKVLLITVPEDLNYGSIFDDCFEQYTTSRELVSTKTTNMGSLFKLTYHLRMKDRTQEKEFIDALRVRNGNLDINLMKREDAAYEL